MNVYPVFVWIPSNISFSVDVPPSNGDDGGAGDILDGRFDGAFFGGVTASNGPWRFEGTGIWAAFGGDRPDNPLVVADADLIYGDARLGRRVARDLYLTAGLRRIALNYDIKLGDLPQLSGKPGLWDPLVGIGWHRTGPTFEWHASFDVGGFGVGSDLDIGATFRVDWKFIPHFGLTGGYSVLHLKTTPSLSGRSVTVKTTLHGPMVGVGLYF